MIELPLTIANKVFLGSFLIINLSLGISKETTSGIDCSEEREFAYNSLA